MWITTTGTLSNDDGVDGNEKGKKAIDLYRQNNNYEINVDYAAFFVAVEARLRHETKDLFT